MVVSSILSSACKKAACILGILLPGRSAGGMQVEMARPINFAIAASSSGLFVGEYRIIASCDDHVGILTSLNTSSQSMVVSPLLRSDAQRRVATRNRLGTLSVSSLRMLSRTASCSLCEKKRGVSKRVQTRCTPTYYVFNRFPGMKKVNLLFCVLKGSKPTVK